MIRGRLIDTIPAGFIDRGLATDWRDRKDEYYPDGVTDSTIVDVVIHHAGRDVLYEHAPAQCFGWSTRPAMPSVAGLDVMDAPITHYRIV